jgi:hypothetical protein
MLWNFATISTFVAVLGSTLFMLMTDREGFLTDREKGAVRLGGSAVVQMTASHLTDQLNS